MENRKKDHIDLAFASQTLVSDIDTRFVYEPMLSAHPQNGIPETDFLGKSLRLPIWVSSMTGGTRLAGIINRNLARACREFGMGMGLGSCRILLEDRKHFSDFDMRDLIGPEYPLLANLGIAQLEVMAEDRQLDRVHQLVSDLRADGLVIHVNPFQEWFQPEGDLLKKPALESIEALLAESPYPVMVKEVGQGMGYESLRALLKLPLAAIEFGAFGGTNFSRVELLRSSKEQQELYEPFARTGHDALQMVQMVNHLVEKEGKAVRCRQLVVSGGVKNFLDGYYLIGKSSLPALYGQASAFLRVARDNYESLQEFMQHQVRGLQLAYAFLRIRD